MRVVILGSTGMLGNYLKNFLADYHDVICLDRPKLNADTIIFSDLLQMLLKPDIIINCIGIIPQRTSGNPQMYFRVNSLFPHMVAHCAHVLGCKFIHVSTDCVYTGASGSYVETDVHDETSVYGLSKSLGEGSDYCVIRTSIIGEEILNRKSLLAWVCQQSEINGYVNHWWNGVTCLQLSKIIHQMIIHNDIHTGVRHVFSPEAVSKYELVKMIVEAAKLDIKVTAFVHESNVDKTLSSIYPVIADIPPLKQQIVELYSLDRHAYGFA